MMKSLLNTFRRTLRDHHLILPRDSVLVAVSGGPDSVCLLTLFKLIQRPLNLKLAAAHVNHRLRKSSDRDEAFVKSLCGKYKIPLYVRRVDVSSVARKRQLSLEEAGREVRYNFFIRQAKRLRLKKIATAHTCDDQAETVLMRLIRGAGVKGIAAIRAKRSQEGLDIIRPLLNVSKETILNTLRASSISYRKDPSNRSTLYLRNRIRRNLLPQIQREYNRQFQRNLVNLADDAAQVYDFLAEEAESNFRSISRRRRGVVRLPISRLQKIHPVLRFEIFFKAIENVQGSRRRLTPASCSLHSATFIGPRLLGHTIMPASPASQEMIGKQSRQTPFTAGDRDAVRCKGQAVRLLGLRRRAVRVVIAADRDLTMLSKPTESLGIQRPRHGHPNSIREKRSLRDDRGGGPCLRAPPRQPPMGRAGLADTPRRGPLLPTPTSTKEPQHDSITCYPVRRRYVW